MFKEEARLQKQPCSNSKNTISIHIPPDVDSMVQCEPLVPIPNSHVRYESVDRTTIQPGDMVTYSCDIPYVLEGDIYRVCISNGSWSGEEPTCTGVCINNN